VVLIGRKLRQLRKLKSRKFKSKKNNLLFAHQDLNCSAKKVKFQSQGGSGSDPGSGK